MTNSSYLSSKVVPDFCDLVYISVRAIDIYVIPLISDNTYVVFYISICITPLICSISQVHQPNLLHLFAIKMPDLSVTPERLCFTQWY